MISVVIPVMNSEHETRELFEQISKNTVLPHEIFLVDNASNERFYKYPKIFSKLNIKYIRYDENRGVNIPWNEGISQSTGQFITFLNNDIIITKYFFEKICKTLISYTDIGVVVPYTVSNKEHLYEDNIDPILEPLDKREGWAFTIRREITEKSGQIPFPFKIYYGDDFLFLWAKKLGYRWVKIMNNPIYHYGSLTVKKTDPNNETLKYEGKIWKSMMENKFEGV